MGILAIRTRLIGMTTVPEHGPEELSHNGTVQNESFVPYRPKLTFRMEPTYYCGGSTPPRLANQRILDHVRRGLASVNLRNASRLYRPLVSGVCPARF
jgi:hypothetical protein